MDTTRRSYCTLLAAALAMLLVLSYPASAQERKVFKTAYSNIRYSDDRALSDFFWRISGKKLDITVDAYPARWAVDRIIDRVQSILDMHPDNFRIAIDLRAAHTRGDIARYLPESNTIVAYADKISDGVFAHEVSHAVICGYFPEEPPEKIQEILAQYVDKYLWSDY
ncbi:MAG: hypothetical protein ABIJ27_05990 [Candidatus Omnitrophota bacterium]